MPRKKPVKNYEDEWFNGIQEDHKVVGTGKIGYEIVARFVIDSEDADIIKDSLEYLRQYGAAEITAHKVF